MRVEDLQVTMERVEDLVPYARNAKKHTEEQVRQIGNSIREFGFADPVGVWQNPDGEFEIVEGHGRVLAAQKLGIDEVPVIRLDALTDSQRRAYMLAHNQLTMNTGWELAELDEALESLAEGFEMGEFGFATVPNFDPVQDLEEKGFATNSLEKRTDEFGMTFTFPAALRGQIERYVKSVGKKTIVERIIREAEEWA